MLFAVKQMLRGYKIRGIMSPHWNVNGQAETMWILGFRYHIRALTLEWKWLFHFSWCQLEYPMNGLCAALMLTFVHEYLMILPPAARSTLNCIRSTVPRMQLVLYASLLPVLVQG